MNFSLIICTYMRPKPLLNLLQSVARQTCYPNQILIIDGSVSSETQKALNETPFLNVQYFKVPPEQRGLTKQRNYGIAKVANDAEVVCFLDDDTVLNTDYFENLAKTYKDFPEALGVGGYITNEVAWTFVGEDYQPVNSEFYLDGWKRKDSSRFVLRKQLGLDSNCPPGFSPEFSHGRSVGFLPPSGKTYAVEQLMGGVSSFRSSVFNAFQFSTYFEGYGLYEDADFSLRVSKAGCLYVNTKAQLAHYHDAAGRPNRYQYGKMVVRNGWYVWHVKNPAPHWNDVLKWHVITLLLTGIRASNMITTPKRKEAFTETMGRVVGWFSLWYSKPKK